MPSTTGPSTIDRILDATLRQLEQHGVRRTTMDDIAQEAGLSRPTLYEYFPNKGAILSAASGRELDRFLADLEARARDAGNPAERLVQFTTNAYLELREHRLLQRLLATEQEVLLPFITADAPGLAVGYEWAARQIAAVAGAAEPAAEHRQVAEMLVRIMHSLVLSPSTSFALGTRAEIEDWARDWLVPWLERLAPS